MKSGVLIRLKKGVVKNEEESCVVLWTTVLNPVLMSLGVSEHRNCGEEPSRPFVGTMTVDSLGWTLT